METTIFLAEIWGPVILAIGLGIFVSPGQYRKIYHDLEKEALALLIFGMAGIAFGIVHISLHNIWNTFPEIVISLFGWGLLIKGAIFTIVPRIADRGGDFVFNSKLLPAVGVLTLLLGIYLSWFAYFA